MGNSLPIHRAAGGEDGTPFVHNAREISRASGIRKRSARQCKRGRPKSGKGKNCRRPVKSIRDFSTTSAIEHLNVRPISQPFISRSPEPLPAFEKFEYATIDFVA